MSVTGRTHLVASSAPVRAHQSAQPFCQIHASLNLCVSTPLPAQHVQIENASLPDGQRSSERKTVNPYPWGLFLWWRWRRRQRAGARGPWLSSTTTAVFLGAVGRDGREEADDAADQARPPRHVRAAPPRRGQHQLQVSAGIALGRYLGLTGAFSSLTGDGGRERGECSPIPSSM